MTKTGKKIYIYLQANDTKDQQSIEKNKYIYFKEPPQKYYL